MSDSQTLVFISDTHGKHEELTIPDGDFLIHCGDVCRHGTHQEVEAFIDWFNAFPHKHKIWIAGNHDKPMEIFSVEENGSEPLATEMKPGLWYLFNAGVELEGIRFWGSPYTPRFFDWAFNFDRGEEMARHWAHLPDDIDVLLTHGPPNGILDFTRHGDHAGCEGLRSAIERIGPKIHAFGHIHESHGAERHVLKPDCPTRFLNATSVNEQFDPINSPHVIEFGDDVELV